MGEEPTPEPTPSPTEAPTEEPPPEPTPEPTEAPTEEPTPEPTPEPTEAPTEEPTPEPTHAPTERKCSDVPVPNEWKDSSGKTCEDYKVQKWCTAEGGYGTGWWSHWQSFSNWARKGVDASRACCNCNGGTKDAYTI